jgi:hypothetical protein
MISIPALFHTWPICTHSPSQCDIVNSLWTFDTLRICSSNLVLFLLHIHPWVHHFYKHDSIQICSWLGSNFDWSHFLLAPLCGFAHSKTPQESCMHCTVSSFSSYIHSSITSLIPPVINTQVSSCLTQQQHVTWLICPLLSSSSFIWLQEYLLLPTGHSIAASLVYP